MTLCGDSGAGGASSRSQRAPAHSRARERCRFKRGCRVERLVALSRGVVAPARQIDGSTASRELAEGNHSHRLETAISFGRPSQELSARGCHPPRCRRDLGPAWTYSPAAQRPHTMNPFSSRGGT